MSAPRKYPLELRERAVRLARESDRPIAQIAADLGIHPRSAADLGAPGPGRCGVRC
ncbi:transposase [Actinomadura macra]|uniref:transposase n=1 Tax=Actinomadura macra TaxID=46164 RepID=UPI0009FC665E